MADAALPLALVRAQVFRFPPTVTLALVVDPVARVRFDVARLNPQAVLDVHSPRTRVDGAIGVRLHALAVPAVVIEEAHVRARGTGQRPLAMTAAVRPRAFVGVVAA